MTEPRDNAEDDAPSWQWIHARDNEGHQVTPTICTTCWAEDPRVTSPESGHTI